MIRTIRFQSNIALHEWLERNKPFVVVLSKSAPMSDFGYEVSIRLKKPDINVTYFEFPRDY